MRAYRRQPMVPGNPRVLVERLQQLERRAWTVDHRDCSRLVQGYHRVRRDTRQQPVQGHDLAPVGLLGARRLRVRMAAMAACSWYVPGTDEESAS